MQENRKERRWKRRGQIDKDIQAMCAEKEDKLEYETMLIWYEKQSMIKHREWQNRTKWGVKKWNKEGKGKTKQCVREVKKSVGRLSIVKWSVLMTRRQDTIINKV
jgi:hypothetical protein